MRKTYQEDHKIMSIINVQEIKRIICDTDKGTLKLCLRKGEKDYYFTLDAVELDKNTNKELFETLYPVVPQSIFLPLSKEDLDKGITKGKLDALTPIKPKGRPKRSKNKVK